MERGRRCVGVCSVSHSAWPCFPASSSQRLLPRKPWVGDRAYATAANSAVVASRTTSGGRGSGLSTRRRQPVIAKTKDQGSAGATRPCARSLWRLSSALNMGRPPARRFRWGPRRFRWLLASSDLLRQAWNGCSRPRGFDRGLARRPGGRSSARTSLPVRFPQRRPAPTTASYANGRPDRTRSRAELTRHRSTRRSDGREARRSSRQASARQPVGVRVETGADWGQPTS